jgi:hypothetical protein
MQLPKMLAICALALIAASIVLLIVAFGESNAQVRDSASVEIGRDSQLVKSMLGERVGDRFTEVNATAWTLRAAGRAEEAEHFQRFVVHCNAQRLITSDRACRDETVRSAIDKGAALGPGFDEPRPVPSEIQSAVARGLSFRLPDESFLRASISARVWRDMRFDSPGVVRYGDAGDAYVFVAAKNGTPWAIGRFRALLVLDLPDESTVELVCDSDNPIPIARRAIQRNEETMATCTPPAGVPPEEIVAALRAQPGDALRVQTTQFDLRDPFVRVLVRGEPSAPELSISPHTTMFQDARDEQAIQYEMRLPRQLRAIDCATRGGCRSPLVTIAVRFSNVFDQYLLLLPILFGGLMGVAVGGFVRRSLRVGGVLAASLGLAVAAGVAWLFATASGGSGDRGFALMGAAAITVGVGAALLVGLPAFFGALLLMRTLHEPDPPA